MTPASVALYQICSPLFVTGHQQCRGVHRHSDKAINQGHKGHQHCRTLVHPSMAHQHLSQFVQGCRGHHHCSGIRPSLPHSHPARSLHTSMPSAVSWREFVLTVQTFGKGVKTIYNDMKLMKQYISEYGGLKIEKSAPARAGDVGKTTLIYPRKEMQFMYRV